MREDVENLHHPLLPAVELDPAQGITPDQAAVIAVVLNPSLRSERDQRGIARAQMIQAGLLPNPQLSASLDIPNDSPQADFAAFGLGLSWEVTSLIPLDAKKAAAKAAAQQVDLDIVWKEWQIAEAAKTAAYDVIALQAELAKAKEIDQRLTDNANLVRKSVEKHADTVLNLAAADSAAQQAHAVALDTQKDLRHQLLTLNRTLGFPAETVIKLRPGIELPSRLDLPDAEELTHRLEKSRIDLLALRRGYESEEQTLRAAVLAQFPKISFGPTMARDTSNVNTIGLGLSIDLPIFDRNQAAIATEKATRKKLFDEYVNRVFEARSDVAMAFADIQSLTDEIAAAEAAVPELRTLVETYKFTMEKGNTDVLSYYTAQGNLAQKELDMLKLKQSLAESKIALELASGRYLSDTPQHSRASETSTAPLRLAPPTTQP